MVEFGIKIAEENKTGVVLNFFSENCIKLMIEDIKYFYSPRESKKNDCEVISIILNNSSKRKFFEFPDNDKDYTSITFLAKELHKDDSLLSVQVDLKNRNIEIKETDFTH